MVDKEVKLKIKAVKEGKGLEQTQAGLKKVDKGVKKTASTAKKGFKAMGSSWMEFAKGILAVEIFKQVSRAIVNFAKDSIEAFAKQEQALARLTSALKNQNEYTEENIKLLTDQAKALQRITTFGDEQIISAQAMLASFALTTDQIKEMTPRMLDLATMTAKTTGGQMDLEQAAKFVGMALGGQAGRLTQAGIRLDDYQKKSFQAADETERFNMLLEIFDQNAGGLAESVGKTATGSIQKFRNVIGDLQEKLGEALIPTIVFFTNAITKLIQGTQNYNEIVDEQLNSSIDLTQQYIKLASKTKLSTEEAQEQADILEDLKILLPELDYQTLTSNIEGARKVLSGLNSELREHRIALQVEENLNKLKEAFKQTEKEQSKYEKTTKIYNDTLNNSNQLFKEAPSIIAEQKNQLFKSNVATRASKQTLEQLSKQFEETYGIAIKSSEDFQKIQSGEISLEKLVLNGIKTTEEAAKKAAEAKNKIIISGKPKTDEEIKAAKKAAEEKKKILEDFNKEYNKATKSQSELMQIELDKQVEAYKKAGAKISELEEWKAAKEIEIAEQVTEENKEVNKDKVEQAKDVSEAIASGDIESLKGLLRARLQAWGAEKIGEALASAPLSFGATLAAVAPITAAVAAGIAAINAISLAEGGVIKAKAGGTLARIGEGGQDEAVIPLKKGAGALGSNVHIHVGAFMGKPADAFRFAKFVKDNINQIDRRNITV